MADTIIHNTFVVERSYGHPPARVFAAFADPALKRRWYAESRGHELDAFELDFRVGGEETFTCRLGPGTPVAGLRIDNHSRHLDIVQNQRIVMSAVMHFNGTPGSVALLTFEFAAAGDGTDLVCTHQAVFYEGSDGPGMRQHGWSALLDRVEAVL